MTSNTMDRKNQYDYSDLLASGRGELFGSEGPQLPAPLLRAIKTANLNH